MNLPRAKRNELIECFRLMLRAQEQQAAELALLEKLQQLWLTAFNALE
ncbi:hypothetical protein JW872_01925 [Candidatus Babeliales bacterium]|nr:hypothetical protein [Candidatus Babeliales bacterium]